MVRQKDIMLGINRIIAAAFSKYPVYLQACPKDFKRPSFLLEYVTTNRTDANRSTVEKVAYFTITCFTPIDQYQRSDVDELSQLQEDTLQLFSCGYLKLGDRAIKVRSSTGGMDFDRAYIDLQFQYFDNRTEVEDTTPLMASVNTNLQEG